MSLTLQIENIDRLDNGEPTVLKLDRHGAVIGRSPHSDWSLPNPKNYISSTHCEIDYRDGAYFLIDKSTNGTLVNGATQRMTGEHRIQNGDLIVIGHYRIRAATKGDVAAAQSPAAPSGPAWAGWGTSDDAAATAAAPSTWDSQPSSPSPTSSWEAPPPAAAPVQAAAAPAASSGWGEVNASAPPKSGWAPLSTGGRPETAADAWADRPAAATSGRGPMAQSWAPPRVETPAAQAWPSAPAASGPAPAEATDDPWSRFAASNSVDWARGGFGDVAPAPPAPPAPPVSMAPPAPVAAAGSADPSPAPERPRPADDGAWAAFLAASGVPPDQMRTSPAEAGRAAGAVMKRLVSGLVVMLEARARAKAQLGAQSTTLELAGNNPLKFARSPERALAQLINPSERGFMDAERAVEDSFQDLQAHQMATLAAMQGALRATLDRFSPHAIGERAETRGLLAKILPTARSAALWEAYLKEFDGVAQGSEEAFLDIFSKAFKAAYEKAAGDMKRSGR